MVGIELNGTEVFPFGHGPVPLIVLRDDGAGDMRIGELTIKLNSPARSGQGPGHGFIGRDLAVMAADQCVRFGEPSVCLSVALVFGDRQIEVLDGAPEIFRCALVPEIKAAQIKIMRIQELIWNCKGWFSGAIMYRTSPTSVAATGSPAAIASRMEIGICSVSEDSANRSKCA